MLGLARKMSKINIFQSTYRKCAQGNLKKLNIFEIISKVDLNGFTTDGGF